MFRLIPILASLMVLSAQEKPSSSVWDGVYTATQASRGETAYKASCTSCHGPSLEGKGPTPPLAGSEFASNWNGRNLGELLEKMQDSMPADRPGQLSKAANAAILAYMLQFNKFPAGKAEMPESAEALRGVIFTTEKK